ncbi:MAG TPA: VOC family protein [Pseudomonadales bacterium]|nr:VOC family protein [Pseudomonadales bacterium]
MTHSGKPIEVRGLDHIVLRVKDLTASLRFYRDVLGFPIERELDLGLVQLRAGAALIDLVPVSSALGRLGGPAAGVNGFNMDHFALDLERFDAAAIFAYLDAHGVQHGAVDRRYGARGTGPSIYVKDPDGNTVELKGPPTDRPQSPV